jgi:hypothetical protein
MKDLAIAVRIGSPKSNYIFVKNTFDSFIGKLKKCDFKVFISIGDINFDVKKLIYDYCSKYPDKFLVYEDKKNKDTSWAESINKAIEISDDYEFFAKSHDDIILKTDNFWELFKSQLSKLNKNLGWISFTDIGFRFGNFNPSTRPGHHIDFISGNSWYTGKIFQFNKFPVHWYKANDFLDFFHTKTNALLKKFGSNYLLNYPKPIKKIQNYNLDMPIKPVYCHAPFNHFVIIKRSVLDIIGKCEEWGSKNALLVDEDWGLSARLHGYPNIWIPKLEYIHERLNIYAGGGTRSMKQINDSVIVSEQKFKKKWGFNSKPSVDSLNFIEREYKNTLLTWSLNRHTFDWDYL